jgi:hypothetical protein
MLNVRLGIAIDQSQKALRSSLCKIMDSYTTMRFPEMLFIAVTPQSIGNLLLFPLISFLTIASIIVVSFFVSSLLDTLPTLELQDTPSYNDAAWLQVGGTLVGRFHTIR